MTVPGLFSLRPSLRRAVGLELGRRLADPVPRGLAANLPPPVRKEAQSLARRLRSSA